MAVTPIVSDLQRYIQPDGKLTIEGLKLFISMIDAIKDNEARLTAGGL